jgi:putative FmdB family regulatory protein
MPTYDYICLSCGHAFEVFKSIHDDSVQNCPKCSGETRKRIGGGAGLLFKGNGFYITDYKKNGSQKKENTPTGDAQKKAS